MDRCSFLVGAAVTSGLVAMGAGHSAIQWFEDEARVFASWNGVVGVELSVGCATPFAEG